MNVFSRRNMLAAGAAVSAASSAETALAATFGNPGEPPQGAVNVKSVGSTSDPGPQNPVLAGQFPSAFNPPPTAVGDLPQFWAS